MLIASFSLVTELGSSCARFGVARSSQAAFMIAGAIAQMPAFNGDANGRDVACGGAAVDYGNANDSGSGDARCGGDRTIPGDVFLADDFETVMWRPTISVTVTMATVAPMARSALLAAESETKGAKPGVGVQLATKCGPTNGTAEPSTVGYALAKIGAVLGVNIVRLRVSGANGFRWLSLPAHGSLSLASVGVVEGASLDVVEGVRSPSFARYAQAKPKHKPCSMM
jgi:hypothetical protein